MTLQYTDAINRRIEELETENRDLALQVLASDGQAQDAYAGQVELEAKLAEVTAERDAWETAHCQSVEMKRKISNWHVEAEARAETAEQRIATLEAMLPRAFKAGVEASAMEIDAQRPDSYAKEALIKRICCNGQDCGCKAADVGSWLTYSIRAIPTPTSADLLAQLKETGL